MRSKKLRVNVKLGGGALEEVSSSFLPSNSTLFTSSEKSKATSAVATIICFLSGNRFLLFFLFFIFGLMMISAGCSKPSQTPNLPPDDVPVVNRAVDTGKTPLGSERKDNSSLCAYWKCSKTKELYLQKYDRQENGTYKPAGVYKLGTGIGAFPLEDLDKYSSNSESVNVDIGFNPCPYCSNSDLVRCGKCDKTSCGGATIETKGPFGQVFQEITCPWCGNKAKLTPSSWNVGGNG